MRRATQDLLLLFALSGLSTLFLRSLLGSTVTTRAADRAARAEPTLPTPRQAPRKIASYEIRAKLDTDRHRVTGQETIRFVNHASVPLHELWFHLYLNAFKNDKTLFLRSPFGAGRSGDKAREYGYIDVKKMSVVGADGADLWLDRDRHSPGDANDETDLRVPLTRPLEPEETLVLELTFEAKLPEIVERTGYSGSFHFLGQWFPKLARLEANGQFAHFAFHPQSEFYADFGDYDVTVDVPSAFHVGATGTQVRERREKGRQELSFHAENVHDFAWTAWDQFEAVKERIAGIDVTVLYPPHQARNAATELDSVRFALPHFNALYGAYPYPTLTVVHPPDVAENAGGMEYPTLITSGGPWYATWGGGHFIDLVTTHELGHQWFYGLVASNEHAQPFLDEGLNSYAEAEAMEAAYGPGSVFRGFGLSVSSSALNRLISTTRGADEPVAQGAGDFASFRNLGALVYGRTANVMSTMARVYGSARVNRALGVYTRKFRFGHPIASDFLGVMQAELGAEAAEAMTHALFSRGTVDYLVREISSAKLTPEAGVFDGPKGREQKKPDTAGAATRFASRAIIYRHGLLELPVDIQLLFEDGSKKVEHWDGHGAAFSIDHVASSPLVSVSIDPEQRILLDDDLSNNHFSIQGARSPRALESLLCVAQVVLGAFGP